MRIRILLSGLILAVFALPAAAQGVAGKWNASGENQVFALVMVFDFMVEGDALTGSLSSEFMPETPITDGMIDGNTLSFKLSFEVGPDGPVTIEMDGVLEGDELTLTPKLPEGAPPGGPAMAPLIAKRVE